MTRRTREDGRVAGLFTLLAVLVAACEAPPAGPEAGFSDVAPVAVEAEAAAHGAGHPVVTLRADGKAGGAGPVTDELGQALQRVAPGGKILVHRGTYSTGGVVVTKPVTLQAVGSGEATLDGTGFCWALEVAQVPLGLVQLKGLRFVAGACGSVSVSSEYDEVLIEESTFEGTGTGVSIGGGVVAGRTVTIRDSDFVGPSAEIRAEDGAGVVVAEGNRLSGPNTNIHFAPGVSGRIEENVLTGCGDSSACISFGGFVFGPGGGAQVHAVANSIEVELPDEQLPSGFLIGDGDHVVTDNVVVGIGSDPGATDVWQRYPLTLAGIEIVDGARAEVSRNRVENTYIGLQFGHPVTAEGLDNVVTGVEIGIQAFDGSEVTIRSSDITEYVEALQAGGPPGVQAFTCNWWGSAAGPTGAGDPALYTPWATSPVAGTSTTTCSGGL